MKTFKFGNLTIFLHLNDFPEPLKGKIDYVSVDTETTGLSLTRDRLCLIQLSITENESHVIKFEPDFILKKTPDNLINLLQNDSITKIFHYARFDLAMIKKYLKINLGNIFCTKIASKLVRTYTDKHGLKDLCREILEIDINKSQQSSDWSSDELSKNQLKYAASDVIHLVKLKSRLTEMLIREKRISLANEMFSFLQTRVELDLLGWNNEDIFSH